MPTRSPSIFRPSRTRRGLDASLLLGALSVMPVDWQAVDVYEPMQADAGWRMSRRDPDGWPTVALAFARSLPIWSQDKDMEAAGLTVYTTGDLLDAIRDVEDAG